MRDLVIIGSGGFSRETAELVAAINTNRPSWRLLGFLDDNPALHGDKVDSWPVLGPIEAVHDFADAFVVVGTGSPRDYASRFRIVQRLGLPPSRYARLVHPASVIASSALIGHGTVVHAYSVLTASVIVGAHVAISPHVVLAHDDVVGDFVTFAAGAHLAGGVRIEEGAYVGAGVLIREGLTIGAWSLIGMGAGVIYDVPPREVWAGTPARRLRDAEVDLTV
jgi:sugar O-acyltransferase (sialic acid O-acetyltransferase NeuD family)